MPEKNFPDSITPKHSARILAKCYRVILQASMNKTINKTKTTDLDMFGDKSKTVVEEHPSNKKETYLHE